MRRRDPFDTPGRELAIELRDVTREYRVGGQTVRALDEISLRLCRRAVRFGRRSLRRGQEHVAASTRGIWTRPIPARSHSTATRSATSATNNSREFRHHRVGFIFQFFNLLPTLSAWENVAVPKLLDGFRLGKVKPDAIQLLDRVGLGDRTQHRPAELSGGQMQRVAVARALMMNPPLILADEPTGNLDSATGASILALLTEVAHEDGRGRLVVMVTHNSDAAATTDRVITLQDGRVGSDEWSAVAGMRTGLGHRGRGEPPTRVQPPRTRRSPSAHRSRRSP